MRLIILILITCGVCSAKDMGQYITTEHPIDWGREPFLLDTKTDDSLNGRLQVIQMFNLNITDEENEKFTGQTFKSAAEMCKFLENKR